jgi:hypothetical protein
VAWKKFPYPETAYAYTPTRLKRAWPRLHAGDAEPWPQDAALLQCWIAFHAGDFELAAQRGLACGIDGYSVAHKASCIYANYLAGNDKGALFDAVIERCELQQAQQPRNAAAYYWYAYALGRQAQDMSVLTALAQGVAGKVHKSLTTTLELAPRHADAHIALGAYHAEIIDKVGAVIGALRYGASQKEGYAHFTTALALNPDSAIARIEYARALLMLEGAAKKGEASALHQAAASCQAQDAAERLDVEVARKACAA